MPLVDVSEEIGSMTFASESHTNGFISRVVISDESHKTLAQHIEAKGLTKVGFHAYATLSGRRSVNVLPRPASLLTSTVPPWASAIALEMESPKPAPPCLRVRDASLL